MMRFIVVALALMAGVSAHADVTNTVPWYDSFETYSNGMQIAGTNGWMGTAASGVVTNWLSGTNYQANGGTYPVPGGTGNHSNVLALTDEMANNLVGTSGGLVRVDFLALTTSWSDTLPLGDPSNQCALCISSNGYPTLWHYNAMVGAKSNEWRELNTGTKITSNNWHRFTVFYDYSNSLFQVAIDETPALVSAFGWTRDGMQPGSWFHMVKTNGVMSQVAASSMYMDDLVATRRSLGWSRTNFMESVTNNGAVDNRAPLLVTVTNDTFVGSAGEDLVASHKLSVVGLPSNLAAVGILTNATQVMIGLTNVALLHEVVNSTNLTFQFADTAFTLGSAWDVVGGRTNMALIFSNAPSLSYMTNFFYEAQANDGTIDNTHPCLVTLTNGSFTGTVGDDFVVQGKVAVSGLPSNLVAVVRLTNATQVAFTLLGVAVSNNVANDVTISLSFLDGAFNVVSASNVHHSSTNFGIRFNDPSYLTYQTSVFTETVTNNGTLNGTTLTLANKLFNATNGEDLALGGSRVSSPNLPSSLALHVVCDATGTNATLFFTGAAGVHAAVNSLTNLEIKFTDNAFVGGGAATVANSDRRDLQISFIDPRYLTYSGLAFNELSGGVIDNRHPVTVTLSGDTYVGNTGDDFTPFVTVGGSMPPGLSAQFTRDSATQLSVRITGFATANAVGNSVNDVSFTFKNGAFAAGYAAYVTDYYQPGISINFTNDSGFFNVTPYQESFEEYASGFLLAGTNGWSGDSVTACIVTNNSAMTSNLMTNMTYPMQFPISTTHAQVLYVQDTVKNQIHSEGNKDIYVDFMARPTPVAEVPMNDASNQSAFCVTTNGYLMIWQQTRNGAAEWIALSNAPVISTSKWSRFTAHYDYVSNMFELAVNQEAPISDPRGWTARGASPAGSWFYMVQTNGVMTEVEINVAGWSLVDDFTVLSTRPTTLPLGWVGSVFRFR